MFFLAALLYSSVGHAGASGYIAAMTFMGLEQSVIGPASPALNIPVALLAIYQFGRAGHVPWRLVPWFIALSIPAAYLGGSLKISEQVFKPLLGCVLLFAAYRLAMPAKPTETPLKKVHSAVALAVGGVVGFFSGLTKTGGGIFLSPIAILFGWADAKKAAGLAAVFILANSVAGLTGQLVNGAKLPPELPHWLACVIAGGAVGSYFGSRRFGNPLLKKLLAAVLVVAAGKLFSVLF